MAKFHLPNTETEKVFGPQKFYGKKNALSPQEVFYKNLDVIPGPGRVCGSEVHDLLTETHRRSLTTSLAVGRRLPFLLDFGNFSDFQGLCLLNFGSVL